MKVLIVEEKKAALESLVQELQALDEDISIMASCNSISECVRWLANNPPPDLIIMDVQLSDGLSFAIFNACNITCPVIFTTTCDDYLTQALEYNSIGYLVKPISRDKLKTAIRKYKILQSHFVNNYSPKHLTHHDKKKSRILVKIGMEFLPVKVEDVVYFFTEHKLVFLVDRENQRFMAEKNNLSELEEDLDKSLFYRANRKYIINANYVRRFKALDRSKISVELAIPVHEEITVSQENSSAFKKWIGEI